MELTPSSLLRLLDRQIAFHPIFVDLTGSVNAALMLSQALYWSGRTQDPEGWFWKTRDEWWEETRLSRTEQENARAKLRQMPFWKESLRGIPAKLYFQIDLEALANSINSLTTELVGGKPANNAEEPKSCRQDGGKPANREAGNLPTHPHAQSTAHMDARFVRPTDHGLNPRALGVNPRADDINPRYLGTNPRSIINGAPDRQDDNLVSDGSEPESSPQAPRSNRACLNGDKPRDTPWQESRDGRLRNFLEREFVRYSGRPPYSRRERGEFLVAMSDYTDEEITAGITEARAVCEKKGMANSRGLAWLVNALADLRAKQKPVEKKPTKFIVYEQAAGDRDLPLKDAIIKGGIVAVTPAEWATIQGVGA